MNGKLPGPPVLTIRPAAVARACAAFIVLLVIAHTVTQIARFAFGHDYLMGLTSRFYLGAEMSVPNWFSTCLLLACGVVLAVIAQQSRGSRDFWHWACLAALFVAMSIDEAAALHDLSAALFLRPFGWIAQRTGLPLLRKATYAWTIPGALAVLAVALSYLKFLWRLPPATRRLFVVAGVVYVGAALGVELVEAWYSSQWGPAHPAFVALVTVEESFEMVGATIFLYALLRYLETDRTGVLLRVESRAG